MVKLFNRLTTERVNLCATCGAYRPVIRSNSLAHGLSDDVEVSGFALRERVRVRLKTVNIHV
jgi:hypothetical protein